jgi:hypothetical protein
MKRSALLALALIGVIGVATPRADAGAAVAWDGGSHLGTAYGGPISVAEQRALANCRRKGGSNARIFAATDVKGFGAIALGRRASRGSVLAVALGKRSATEADTVALEHCRKAGGINPKVKWGWRG